MRIGDGELTYPVPWATTAASSAVAKPAHYRAALQAAGFSVVAERNRRISRLRSLNNYAPELRRPVAHRL